MRLVIFFHGNYITYITKGMLLLVYPISCDVSFFSQNLNKLAALVRGELPKLTRNILCALITIDVHARDIVTGMVEHQVTKSLINQQLI